ncbi:MAG: SGNH/GDSL hydrolase family protein [Pseudomonadota bacterium]|nr:SGNH/GDSL hydrolase family protein [Pseudomonadota bacterium]
MRSFCSVVMLFLVGLASSTNSEAAGETRSSDSDAHATDSDDQRRRDYVFVSLGDSITSAFNTRFLGSTANKRYSWSTGNSSKVKSHYSRLKSILNHRIRTYNLARNGAHAVDIVDQYKKVADKRIDYLTLLVGANDLCEWSSDHTADLLRLAIDLRYVVSRAISNNKKIKIVMPAVPDMYHLYREGRERCQFKWDFFAACPRLLSSASNEIRRQRFVEQLRDVNKLLRKVAEDYPANIKHIDKVYNFKFTKDHISSIDCFHPSVRGQNELAKITWLHGWMFD